MKITDISGRVTLNNGVEMPYLGLGVYKSENGGTVESAIEVALDAGYRLIDTASFYDNEEGVGNAINSSTIPRKDIFVTTKVWNDDQGYENTLKAFDTSLKKMNLEYIDLYLVHWPIKGKYVDTWRALEKLYHDGVVKAIGVSNFTEANFNTLLQSATIVPAVNQVEFHPLHSQGNIRAFCAKHGIQPESWSPLIQGRILTLDRLKEIGEKYNKTNVQVTLRWNLQSGVVTIPKSSNPERIRANGDIFDFELSPEDMAAINALNRDERLGPHPDFIDV